MLMCEKPLKKMDDIAKQGGKEERPSNPLPLEQLDDSDSDTEAPTQKVATPAVRLRVSRPKSAWHNRSRYPRKSSEDPDRPVVAELQDQDLDLLLDTDLEILDLDDCPSRTRNSSYTLSVSDSDSDSDSAGELAPGQVVGRNAWPHSRVNTPSGHDDDEYAGPHNGSVSGGHFRLDLEDDRSRSCKLDPVPVVYTHTLDVPEINPYSKDYSLQTTRKHALKHHLTIDNETGAAGHDQAHVALVKDPLSGDHAAYSLVSAKVLRRYRRRAVTDVSEFTKIREAKMMQLQPSVTEMKGKPRRLDPLPERKLASCGANISDESDVKSDQCVDQSRTGRRCSLGIGILEGRTTSHDAFHSLSPRYLSPGVLSPCSPRSLSPNRRPDTPFGSYLLASMPETILESDCHDEDIMTTSSMTADTLCIMTTIGDESETDISSKAPEQPQLIPSPCRKYPQTLSPLSTWTSSIKKSQAAAKGSIHRKTPSSPGHRPSSDADAKANGSWSATLTQQAPSTPGSAKLKPLNLSSTACIVTQSHSEQLEAHRYKATVERRHKSLPGIDMAPSQSRILELAAQASLPRRLTPIKRHSIPTLHHSKPEL